MRAQSFLARRANSQVRGTFARIGGESVASFARDLALSLIKRSGEKISAAGRVVVFANRDYKRAACGETGDNFDNVLQLDCPCPLRDRGDNT